MEITGRNLIEGVPRTVTIGDAELRQSRAECVSTIVNARRVALERLPPELSPAVSDRGIGLTRGGGSGFLHNYILLHDANADNLRLRAEVDRLKLDNIYLKTELSRADRAKALELFQQHTASKFVAATIIVLGAGSNSKVVFVDRGTV